MKIRFIKGTTLAGGVPVNPGEIHDVNVEDAHRFVKVWRDAEYYTPAMEATAKVEAATAKAEAATAEAEAKEESKKGKKI